MEQTAAAHSDLESSICDVSDMANVCRLLMEHFQAELKVIEMEKFSPANSVALIDRLAGPISFCVHHLHQMAHELRNDYYAPLDKAS